MANGETFNVRLPNEQLVFEVYEPDPDHLEAWPPSTKADAHWTASFLVDGRRLWNGEGESMQQALHDLLHVMYEATRSSGQ